MSSFIWGGNTGLSYEDLKQRQAFATQMQQRGAQSRPRNAIEGLNSAANSVLGALLTNRLSKEEARRRDDYTANEYNPLTGGQQPQYAPYMPFMPEAGNTAPQESPDEGDPRRGMFATGANAAPSGMFGSLEQKYGLPTGYLARTAQIESGGNPNAKNPNSSATGAFQFIDSTAAQYGLTDPTDLNASADAAARLARDNAAALERVLGRKPNAAELYLAHQQGAGGAAKLLANPNARAVDIVGADAVRLNGGNLNMTAGQFAGLWLGKFGGQGASQAPSGPDPRIMQAMSSPYATPGQRSVLGALLQQQMQASDPMRQLQMQKAQLELEQLQNPQLSIEELSDGRKYYVDTTGKQPPRLVNDALTPQVEAPKVQTLKMPDGSDVAVQWDKQSGTWVPINAPEGGGTAVPKNKLTENQSKLTLFSSMMNETAPVLEELEGIWNPAQFSEHAAGYFGPAGNYWKSPEGQQYAASANAWAEGALRIATGAAAQQQEIDRVVKTYFAQPGDSPQTVQFKRQMREMYSRAIRAGLGETNIEGALELPDPEDFADQVQTPSAAGQTPQAGGAQGDGWQDVNGIKIRVKP